MATAPDYPAEPPPYMSKADEAAGSGYSASPATVVSSNYPVNSAYASAPPATAYVQGHAPYQAQPVTVANHQAQGNAVIVASPAQIRRQSQALTVTTVLMALVGGFGLFMLLAGIYLAAKDIRVRRTTYFYSEQNGGYRDWYQGIWAGLVHIAIAVAAVLYHLRAKKKNFELEISGLRPWGYLLAIGLFCLTVFAFVAMVMCAVTAGELSSNDKDLCKSIFSPSGHGAPCFCGDIYVSGVDCNGAFSHVHGLYTAMAVFNALIVIIAPIAGGFFCATVCQCSCLCCYSNPYPIVQQPTTVTTYVGQAPPIPTQPAFAGQPMMAPAYGPGQVYVAQPVQPVPTPIVS